MIRFGWTWLGVLCLALSGCAASGGATSGSAASGEASSVSVVAGATLAGGRMEYRDAGSEAYAIYATIGARRGLVTLTGIVGAEEATREEVTTVPGIEPRAGYTFDVSVDRCREDATGQFAPDVYCRGRAASSFTTPFTDQLLALAGEASVGVPLKRSGGLRSALDVGAGYSLAGVSPAPYGSGGFSVYGVGSDGRETGRATARILAGPGRALLSAAFVYSF